MSKKIWRELGLDEAVRDGDKFSFGPWNEGDNVRLFPDGNWEAFDLKPAGHTVAEFRTIPGKIYEDFRVYRLEKQKKIPLEGNPGWYELRDDDVIKPGDRFSEFYLSSPRSNRLEEVGPKCTRDGVCRFGRLVSEAKAEWPWGNVRLFRKRKHNRLLEAQGWRLLSDYEPVEVGDRCTFQRNFRGSGDTRINGVDFCLISVNDPWIGRTIPQIAVAFPHQADAIVFRKLSSDDNC